MSAYTWGFLLELAVPYVSVLLRKCNGLKTKVDVCIKWRHETRWAPEDDKIRRCARLCACVRTFVSPCVYVREFSEIVRRGVLIQRELEIYEHENENTLFKIILFMYVQLF